MSDSVQLRLPTKSEFVSVARLTASVFANHLGFNIEDIEDIKVAVSEACNNAVLHSKMEEEYNIRFDAEADSMVVVIEDLGNGFDIGNYEEPDLTNPKDGGLGIFIMKSLMDEVTIETYPGMGTMIKLIKRVNQ